MDAKSGHLRDSAVSFHRTKEFLEKLIDAAGDGIIAGDRDGTVVLFNKAAEQVFGYRAEEAIGRLSVEALYPPGVARNIMRRLRESGGQVQFSRQEIVARSGEIIPVILSASIVYEHGQEMATIGIVSDLRERLRIVERLRQAQEKLAVSEKQAVVAELAGATAHELNQPLTSILGYAELLRRRLAGDAALVEMLGKIHADAERMAEIVRTIGRITRYETKDYVGPTRILDLERAAEDGGKKSPVGAPKK